MKKRAVVIRLVCYFLMLAAVLVWPIGKIIHYDFPKIPPQTFVFPLQNEKLPDSGESHYVNLGCWMDKTVSSQESVPDGIRTVFVTLAKDAQGTVKPKKVYFRRREIPKGEFFIRASYLFQEKNKILFFVSPGHYYLAADGQTELHKKDSRISAVLKVYADGTFQIDSLQINGKKF